MILMEPSPRNGRNNEVPKTTEDNQKRFNMACST